MTVNCVGVIISSMNAKNDFQYWDSMLKEDLIKTQMIKSPIYHPMVDKPMKSGYTTKKKKSSVTTEIKKIVMDSQHKMDNIRDYIRQQHQMLNEEIIRYEPMKKLENINEFESLTPNSVDLKIGNYIDINSFDSPVFCGGLKCECDIKYHVNNDDWVNVSNFYIFVGK